MSLKKTTGREKLLLMLFPAIVIVAAYSWLFLSASKRSIKAAQQQLARACQSAPLPGELSAVERRLSNAARERRDLEAELKDAETRLEAVRSRWGGVPSGGIEAIASLTDSLRRHGLVLIEEKEVSSPGFSGRADLASVFAELKKSGRKRFREVRFAGRYGDARDALLELARGGDSCVPLELSMEPAAAPDTPERVWTLLVWF